jgi:hypothetical protein
MENLAEEENEVVRFIPQKKVGTQDTLDRWSTTAQNSV